MPWAPDVQVVYEHYHRYLWAQPLVAGRRVLDLGSGEGFGSALLAEAARDGHRSRHRRAGGRAQPAQLRGARTSSSASDSAERLVRRSRDDAFDAVVAFEMIEHVGDQEAVLAEVARVLAPGGLLIVSTPERRAYSDVTGYVNPFHERELTQ